MRERSGRDGATTRRHRFLLLCELVDQAGVTGVHVVRLQTEMTIREGLTRNRTMEYLRELSVAGILWIHDNEMVTYCKGESYLNVLARVTRSDPSVAEE